MITGKEGFQNQLKREKPKVIMPAEFFLDKQFYSNFDRLKGFKYPKEMSKELAEEIGIHIGDGSLYEYQNAKQHGYVYSITSGSDELDYVKGYLLPLMHKLYGLTVKVYFAKKNSLKLDYNSKALFYFKKQLGLPVGKKDNLQIPDCVLNSGHITDFLRGLMDTDGYLYFAKKTKTVRHYPRMCISSKSSSLILQLSKILTDLDFNNNFCLDKNSRASNGTICKISEVFICGKKNLENWIDLIGFSNPKNLRKAREWQAKGYIE